MVKIEKLDDGILIDNKKYNSSGINHIIYETKQKQFKAVTQSLKEKFRGDSSILEVIPISGSNSWEIWTAIKSGVDAAEIEKKAKEIVEELSKNYSIRYRKLTGYRPNTDSAKIKKMEQAT